MNMLAFLHRPHPTTPPRPTFTAGPVPELGAAGRETMEHAARHWARKHQLTYHVTLIGNRYILTARPDDGALILFSIDPDGTSFTY